MKARPITPVLYSFFISLLLINLSLCDTKVRTSTHRTRRPLKVPHNFGKTNFIVGLPAEYITDQADTTYNDQNCIREVYFSPDDDLQKELISYIEQEKKAEMMQELTLFRSKKLIWQTLE